MKKCAVGVLALALVLGGLALSPAPAGAADPVKIGSLYPLSGALALLGEESWRGAEIARVLRNKAGGIAGRQIEFVKADIPDVSAARSEAERLVRREGLKVLLGSYASSLSLAASEVTARAGATYFEMGGISDDITKRGYKTVFRTNPYAGLFVVANFKFIQEWLAPKLGKKPAEVKVAMAFEDSAYGTSVFKGAEIAAKQAGVNVSAAIPYSKDSVDLSSVVLKLKGDSPDALVLVSYANDAILLCRQSMELGLGVKAIVGNGGGHSLASYKDAMGKAADGTFTTDFTQYEVNTQFTPGLKEFVDAYKATFKEAPRSGHSLANFMGANVLFDAIEQTKGDLGAEPLRKALMAMDVPAGKTATGWGVKFDESGQNTRAEPFIMQWRDGKLVTVFPKGAAVMEPVLMNSCMK